MASEARYIVLTPDNAEAGNRKTWLSGATLFGLFKQLEIIHKKITGGKQKLIWAIEGSTSYPLTGSESHAMRKNPGAPGGPQGCSIRFPHAQPRGLHDSRLALMRMS